MSSPQVHLIIGDGVAGMSAAQMIRSAKAKDRVVILSNDPQPFYYRAALTNFMAGRLEEEELPALPLEHWATLKLERVRGVAQQLDAAASKVVLGNGETIAYDRLLVACGASARRLQTPEHDPKRGVPGADLPGVFSMRTIADTHDIIERSQKAHRVVVLGGGILGIEIAHAMHERGIAVTLVHNHAPLWQKVLNQRAGELVQVRMQRAGVNVVLDSGIQEIRGSKRGGVRSVVLKGGQKINCSMVVCSIGIQPNTGWLRESGLPLAQGGYLQTDSYMRVPGTENIWAAGDLVTVTDSKLPFPNPSGLWQPARKQGQVAGIGMAASSSAHYQPYLPGAIYDATCAWDLDVGSMGMHVGSEGEHFQFEDRREGKPILKEILVRDGRVMGALLLGDRREGNALRHLMNFKGSEGDVSGIAHRLLDPDFNLAGWVAERLARRNVERFKQTALVPVGALPASLAAAENRRTSQIDMAMAAPMVTRLLDAVASHPIQLRSQGQNREFVAQQVVIGAGPECEIDAGLGAGLERLILTWEGGIWTAVSTEARRPQATRNGQRLVKPSPLFNRDFLRLGDWKAMVVLPDVEAAEVEERRPEVAARLTLGERIFELTEKVTLIGSHRDNMVVIDDPTVSPFHAQIHREGPNMDQFYVMDVAGDGRDTFVNDERVQASSLIEDGDILRLESLQLRFEIAATHHEEKGGRRASGACVLLEVMSGPLAGRAAEAPLPAGIGRGRDTDIQLDDQLLSREHARFELDGDVLAIRDVNALNGVLVDGQRMQPGELRLVDNDSIVRMGANEFRLSVYYDENAASEAAVSSRSASKSRADGGREFMIPKRYPVLNAAAGRWRASVELKTETGSIGRDAACTLMIPDMVISREHASLEKIGDTYAIHDLESQHGTFVNGQKLDSQERMILQHDDTIQIGRTLVVFQLPPHVLIEDAAVAHDPPVVEVDDEPSGFRIDAFSHGDPLVSDLRKTVQEELDACIGCHECMRACPLEGAGTVSIKALNAYGAGIGEPNQDTLKFVNDCTQCHACVPVCPADIHRSRIVLWNKLKQAPSPADRPRIQIGERTAPASWTMGDLSTSLEQHPLLGKLSGPERMDLLGGAQFRQLARNEVLIREGEYVETVWFILDGRIQLGMTTDRSQFQEMVALTIGQCIGEASALSDQPSAVSAVSLSPTVVMGLPKYSLKSSMKRNETFRKMLESMYIQQGLDFFLRKMPQLENATPGLLEAIADEMDAERYTPGSLIFGAERSGHLLAIVRRGFVKEIRFVNGKEVVANYLNEGDAFGCVSTSRRGQLVRFEASTLCEVVSLDQPRLQSLEQRWPGLSARLLQGAEERVQPGQTELFHDAACAGLLQTNRLMVIDTRICVDCDNCVTACERRHGTARLDRNNAGLQVGPYQVPASCFHCQDPVCLLCAVDGIVREPSGEIRIIEDNCIGCAACATRCPYDNIKMAPREPVSAPPAFLQWLVPTKLQWWKQDADHMDDQERIAVKCDLCADFQNGFAAGPACVRSCPTGAAQRVDALSHFGSNQDES